MGCISKKPTFEAVKFIKDIWEKIAVAIAVAVIFGVGAYARDWFTGINTTPERVNTLEKRVAKLDSIMKSHAGFLESDFNDIRKINEKLKYNGID